MEVQYDQISDTAKLVAHLRSFTDIPYARQMAEAIGAEAAYHNITGADDTKALVFAPIVEARFKALSKAIERLGIKDIMEVAAGVSVRGLIMTEDPMVNYLETDLPGILGEKVAIMDKVFGRRPNLNFAEVNLMEKASLMAAVRGLHGLPFIVCHEGLLPYFDSDEKRQAASNIRDATFEHNGYWVTTDFSVRPNPKLNQDRESIRQKVSAHTSRNVSQHLFQNQEEVDDFIPSNRFRIVHRWSYQELVGPLVTMPAPHKGGDRILQELVTSTVYVLKPI